jgi:hypothetical protein
MLLDNRPALGAIARPAGLARGRRRRGLGATPSCGASNGAAFPGAPTTGFCGDGSAPTQGPYSNGGNPPAYWWICGSGTDQAACSSTTAAAGTGPAPTKSIAAPTCGASNGQTLPGAPTTGFCGDGSAPTQGPYSNGGNPPAYWWICGSGAGQASCSSGTPAAAASNPVLTATFFHNGAPINPLSVPLQVGDTFTITLTGAKPNQSVTALRSDGATAILGMTDANGDYVYSGGITAAYPAGSFVETVSAGGATVGTYSFSVAAPASSGGSTPPAPAPSTPSQACDSSSLNIAGFCVPLWGLGLGALVALMALGGRR